MLLQSRACCLLYHEVRRLLAPGALLLIACLCNFSVAVRAHCACSLCVLTVRAHCACSLHGTPSLQRIAAHTTLL